MFLHHILLGKFSHCHVWMKISVCFAIRKNLHYFSVNLLQFLIFFCLRIQKYRPVRKKIHFPESYFKWFIWLQLFLEKIERAFKKVWMDKRKTDIDVGFPSWVCRVMNFSDSLNLLVVLVCNYWQGSVSHKFVGFFLHGSRNTSQQYFKRC